MSGRSASSLYEMVAAPPAVCRPDDERRHRGHSRTRLRAADRGSQPEVPPELARIVGKALRKDPEQRYQVMKDLLLDLEALREETTLRPAPAGSVPAASRASRRRRWAVALPLILAFLGIMWWYRLEVRLRFSEPPPVPGPVDRPSTRLTFDQGLQTDPAFSPDGRSIAYASDRAGNFDIWVQAIDGSQPRQLTHSPSPDTQPAWSPDGTRIVFRSERDQGGLFRVSADGGPETQLTTFGVHPVWSAKGTEVLFRTNSLSGVQSALHAVSPDGGEQPREVAQPFVRSGDWTWVAPHPDGLVSAIGVHLKSGQGFYTSSRDGTKAFASKLGKDGQWTQLAQTTQRFQWNADGTALYVEAVLNEVRNVWRVRVDPITREWLAAERLTAGAGQDVAAAVAPAGGRLAFSVQRQSTRLWDFPLDASTGRIAGQGTPFTPEDGRAQTLVAFAGWQTRRVCVAARGQIAGRADGHRPGHQQDRGVRVECFRNGLVTGQQDAGVPADASRHCESRRMGAGGAGNSRLGTDHPPLDQGRVCGPNGLDAGWQIHHLLVHVSAFYREGEDRCLAADAVSGTDRAHARRGPAERALAGELLAERPLADLCREFPGGRHARRHLRRAGGVAAVELDSRRGGPFLG